MVVFFKVFFDMELADSVSDNSHLFCVWLNRSYKHNPLTMMIDIDMKGCTINRYISVYTV